jgi:hypothetical protein
MSQKTGTKQEQRRRGKQIMIKKQIEKGEKALKR